MERADLIVIGSGQGGVPLAVHMARRGQSVWLFERSALGGSCINYACIPSKAFLTSAHAAADARNAAHLGIHVDARVDFSTVMARVRDIVDARRNHLQERIEDAGVRLVHAEASFVDRRTVSGGGETVQAPVVVINTGKSPVVPDIPGLADTPYMTYTTFWQMNELLPRTLVLGGGYTGLELGQGLARLGSEVYIVERNERPISREEPEVSQALQEALEEDGVRFYLNAHAEQVAYRNGRFSLTLRGGETLEGEALLVAAGRRASTRELNLPATGVEVDEWGQVVIDDHFCTTCHGVYAIADVAGQPQFTHVSWEDFRRLMAILDGKERTRNDRVLGYAFFTEPQVGRAGMTLKQAQEAGYRARAVTRPIRYLTRATTLGRRRGFYRMVIDEDTGRILGATLVAPDAAEVIHVFIAHIEVGSTWQVLDRSMHIHPTMAEGLPDLAREFAR